MTLNLNSFKKFKLFNNFDYNIFFTGALFCGSTPWRYLEIYSHKTLFNVINLRI